MSSSKTLSPRHSLLCPPDSDQRTKTALQSESLRSESESILSASLSSKDEREERQACMQAAPILNRMAQQQSSHSVASIQRTEARQLGLGSCTCTTVAVRRLGHRT